MGWENAQIGSIVWRVGIGLRFAAHSLRIMNVGRTKLANLLPLRFMEVLYNMLCLIFTTWGKRLF